MVVTATRHMRTTSKVKAYNLESYETCYRLKEMKEKAQRCVMMTRRVLTPDSYKGSSCGGSPSVPLHYLVIGQGDGPFEESIVDMRMLADG